MVRDSYLPRRTAQTGIGEVEVQVKVHVANILQSHARQLRPQLGAGAVG